MEPEFDRIAVETGKCGGKPCIRGMRIRVRRALELLATYPNRESLFADYPFLEPEDLQQVLRYAPQLLTSTRVLIASVTRLLSPAQDGCDFRTTAVVDKIDGCQD